MTKKALPTTTVVEALGALQKRAASAHVKFADTFSAGSSDKGLANRLQFSA
jgi:hypothetical protein